MIDPQAAVPVTNPDLVQQVAQLNAVLTQLSSFLSHLSVGGATAHLLEWAKGKPGMTRWWDVLSTRGKTIVGALLAGLGSLGISAVFAHDPNQAGVYSIVITGLTWSSVGSHLWSFIQSWVLQQGWYQSVIKPKPVAGVTQKPTAPPVTPVVVTPEGGG